MKSILSKNYFFHYLISIALAITVLSPAPAQAAVATFNCSGGGTYTVDSGVISDMYSGNCVGAVVLDSSVTRINYATYVISTVTSITIPATTATIEVQPFIGGSGITAINVDAANPNFKSVNGILYNKTGTTLIQYPQAKTGDSFTVPAGVTTIGNYAFSCAIYLHSVTIPDAVTDADNIDRINGCNENGISEYIVGSGNANYSSIDGVIFDKAATTILAYPANKSGASYVMPSSVTAIRNQALGYSNGRKLESITLSPNLTTIDTYSFSNLYLPTLNIPASVTTISPLGLWTVGAVTVDPGNTSFSAEDNVLFNFNKTKLVYYPSGNTRQSYTIPSTVTQLETYSISNPGNSLERLVIGSALTSVGSWNGAYNLKYLTISGDTTYDFGSLYFGNLISVSYCGSNATTISNIDAKLSSWNNATRICATNPAFTISASSESVAVGTAITGYTIASTGGAITRYSISPSISNTPGLSFSTSTGRISGTPTTAAAARTYIVTAINSESTATRNFTLTVTAAVNTGSYSAGTGQVNCGTSGYFVVTSYVVVSNSNCAGSATIPSGVTAIGSYAFVSNSTLTSVTIPNSVTIIGIKAFAYTLNLTAVTIPSSVTSIQAGAFKGATTITTLNIPSGITEISSDSFSYMSSLTSLTISSSVTSIGAGAFTGATSLASYNYCGSASADQLLNSGLGEKFRNPCPLPDGYVPPPLLPFLKAETFPQIHLSEGKLICTAGTYQTGNAVSGVIQSGSISSITPNSYVFNLLIDGVAQRSLTQTTSSNSVKWALLTAPKLSIATCSVVATAQALTTTNLSSENEAGLSNIKSIQAKAVASANRAYKAAQTAHAKAFVKDVADNRALWVKRMIGVTDNYNVTVARIQSGGGSKMVTDIATALELMVNARRGLTADYLAYKPAMKEAQNRADKAALEVANLAITNSNSSYWSLLESIGYGVLIQG